MPWRWLIAWCEILCATASGLVQSDQVEHVSLSKRLTRNDYSCKCSLSRSANDSIRSQSTCLCNWPDLIPSADQPTKRTNEPASKGPVKQSVSCSDQARNEIFYKLTVPLGSQSIFNRRLNESMNILIGNVDRICVPFFHFYQQKNKSSAHQSWNNELLINWDLAPRSILAPTVLKVQFSWAEPGTNHE